MWMYRKTAKFIQMAVSKYIHLLIAILICCLKDSMGIDAPDYVAVSNEGNTDSLKVTWIPPADATYQEVIWSPPEGLGSSGNMSGTATEYNITGLTPGTLYDVTVTAYDGTDGNSTDPVEGRTRPSPVSDLTESGATNESISASWTKPYGMVDQYLVSCSDGTVHPNSTITDDDRDTAYGASCVGLSTAGADYTITVTSQSGNENSSVSTIPITALPSQVIDLDELGSTNDSVSANWTKPPGVVTSYTVICPSGSNQTIPEDYDGSTKEVTCEDLPDPGPGGNHTITVIALSGDKASDPATVTITAYPNSANLTASEITTRQITVQWPDPNGVENFFIVDCAADETTDVTLFPGDATGNTFQATCNVTMAGASFNITVVSVGRDKQSSVTETFMAAAPNAVTIVDTSSNTTSITVSWNALATSDGFEVSCSNGTSFPSSPLPGSATQATCDGVTPGGNHSVSIVTVENNGRSPATVTYVVAVPERVNLTEVSDMVNTTTITASWSNANGVFDYYEVSCSNGTASPAQVNPLDDLIASCIGLPTPGDDYDISVTTVSNGLYSEAAAITITALPDAVTLVEGPSNNTAISATWTVLGVVDSFTIICSNGTASPSSIPVESSPTSDTFIAYCTGLPTPGLEYNISVGAISNNKLGAIRTVGVHASPSGIILEEGPSTTTSVSATWMKPDGAVEHYEITCSSGEASPSNITDTAQPSYSASCVNLPTPGDTYTMTVYSFVDSGRTSSSSSINLIALPTMVTDLMELGATNDSVSANWTKPAGVVTSYNITCPDLSSQTIQENNDNSTHMVTCDGLQSAGANYTITVIAISGSKAGAPATIAITAYPNSVVLRAGEITTRQITVLWDDPDGVEDSFIVDCADDGTTDVTLYPGDATNGMFQATCDVPMAGAPYNITVISVSGDKWSSVTATFLAATPSAVTIVGVSSNATSVTVSWNALATSDGFEVNCSEGSSSPPSPLPGSATEVTCDGVTPGGNHSVSVVTLENNGRSPATVTYVVAVPPGVDLQEGPSTLTSVSATWMRQNDTVESYSIRCSQGDAFPSTIEDTSQQSYSASCVNLTGPGATYTMFVYSEVGTNTPTNSTGASSLIHLVAVPESVESISVVDYTSTTVDVEWQLKDCSTCVHNHFILTCEPDSQDPITVDYTNGVTQFSSHVSNLTQGRSYNFTVVSVSGVGVEDATPKTSNEQNVEQRTVPATPYGLNIIPTQRTLSLTWSYPGDADDFIITVMPSEGTAAFNGDLVNPAGEVSGLTPGTEYNASVVTISGDERSEPQTEGTRTLPHKPSPVQNPVADPVDKNTITLTYKSPTSPNGIIVSYIISYIGTRDNLPDHEFTYVFDPILTVTFDGLYPGYTYIFTIIAVNDGGYESEPVSTEPVTTPEEVPAPVPEDYPYEENTVSSDVSTKTITVELPSDLFSHENGELMTFSVIITTQANDAAVGSTELTYEEAMSQRENGITPAYVTKNDIPYPYPPSFGFRRRRRATEPSLTVVVGDGTCSGSSPEYCNGALNDDTEYYYAFRAYNSRGSTTSNTFGPVTTDKDNLVAIVVGVTVPLVIILVIIVVICMYLRRREQGNLPRSNAKNSDNPDFVPSGYEMVRTIQKPTSSMPNQAHSRPVLLTNFEEYYRQMKAENDFRFTEEYDEIRKVGKDQPIVAALEMVNKDKNRFVNILPYDHSRVELKALDTEPGSDYINANYVPGYTSSREFIACQLPLLGTMDDMWRMVWDEKSSIIVMLTKDVQPGKDICLRYWDENNYPVKYGSIVVSLQAVKHYDHWNIREFTLVKAYEIRKLTQYQFTGWPDHGVPDPTQTMLDFVRMVREAIQKEASEHPVIVHCSAGVGRTGVYIALDHLMQVMQENDTIDIFGVVCEMRQYRCEMVQSKRQYVFIHKCILDLLQSENSAGKTHYVNIHANNEEDTSRIYCTTIPIISHPDM